MTGLCNVFISHRHFSLLTAESYPMRIKKDELSAKFRLSGATISG